MAERVRAIRAFGWILETFLAKTPAMARGIPMEGAGSVSRASMTPKSDRSPWESHSLVRSSIANGLPLLAFRIRSIGIAVREGARANSVTILRDSVGPKGSSSSCRSAGMD